MQLLLFDMQSQNGLPTLELALPHTEKEREGGERKALWWKDWTQPPTRTLSLPPSLPCPVELIWQRGGSISQFTQAAAAFFVLCLLLRSPCLCLHPHPPLCSLCARLFAHVCVRSVCVILHALGGGIIPSTVRWKTVQPLRLATPASYKLCSWGVMAQVSPPIFTHPHVPPLIVQSVTSSTCLPLLFFVSFHTVFTLIKPL